MNNFSPSVLDGSVKMSTIEIAKITGKKHKNVLADCRKMFDSLTLDAAEFSAAQTYGNNNSRNVYELDKELTLTLVSGYDIKMRSVIVKRWLELEEKVDISCLPQTLPDALRCLADKVEENRSLEHEKNQAQAALGFNSLYLQVKGISWLGECFVMSKKIYSIIGKELSKLSMDRGYSVNQVPDVSFGKVNAYHEDVIQVFKQKLEDDLFYLSKYRIVD